MHEILLSSGVMRGAGHFPDSGPGTKNLKAGDEQLGWFGEVSTSELFTVDELSNLVGGFYGGIGTAEANVWLKFFYKGKVLFISKRAIRSGVSWTELYENGLVYGTNGNGSFPTANPTDQFKQVAKTNAGRIWPFLIRLPTVMDVDPSPAVVSNSNGVESEWSQLLGRVVAGVNNDVTKWENYTLAEMGVLDRGVTGLHSWGMETSSTANANKAVGGYFTQFLYRSFEPGTAISRTNQNYGGVGFFGWRPVLELIPANTLNRPYQVKDNPIGPKQLVIREAVPQISVFRPQCVLPTNWKGGVITIKEPMYSLTFPRVVIPVTISHDLKAFTISGSYVA